MPETPSSPAAPDWAAELRRRVSPIGPITLRDVVKALTGCNVLAWEPASDSCRALSEPLSRGVASAAREMATSGIQSARPNEVGNYIEPFIKKALRREGFSADIPDLRSGAKQSAGYPDILLTIQGRPAVYLECKTFNAANEDTTQRSFYLSPPLAKVTRDGFHLLAAFEIEKRGDLFYPTRYRVLSIESLELEVKHEFNSSNRVIYRTCPTLFEGRA